MKFTRQVWAWAFYDFANSGYVLIIISFVFPIFFREVVAGEKLGDFYWGLLISSSILLGGLLAPVVGATADYDGRKKTKFALFALLAMVGTALLYFSGSGTLLLAALIFIVTNLCFEVAQTLYDSFLGQVSTKDTVGRISGLAWGLGYLGGIAAMLLLRSFYEGGFAGDLERHYKLTFPLVAVFFFLFSMPAFVYLKDMGNRQSLESLSSRLKAGVKKTLETVKNIKLYKNIAWFLLAFYLLNDALVTVFAFMPIFARTTVGFSLGELTKLFLLVQILAFPAATFFGWLADRQGPKKILLFSLLIWMLIVAVLAWLPSKRVFYGVALLAALVIGSSQAVARSWLSQLVPEEKRFEFFGFNGFASKIAATTGPILFGAVSALTGSQRLAVLSLLPFFIASFIIFLKVKNNGASALPNQSGI